MTGRGSNANTTATGNFAAEKKAPNNPGCMPVYSVAICILDDSWLRRPLYTSLNTFGTRYALIVLYLNA